MGIVVAVCLIVTGVIHFAPVTGVLGTDRQAALYGARDLSADEAILMRHRAVLFGLLGLLLLAAAFPPELRLPAILGGLVSTLSFLWLAWSVGHGPALGKVVAADLVAIVALVIAGAGMMTLRGTA